MPGKFLKFLMYFDVYFRSYDVSIETTLFCVHGFWLLF